MHSLLKLYVVYLLACRHETTVLINTETNGQIDTNLSVDSRTLRIAEFDLKILGQYM